MRVYKAHEVQDALVEKSGVGEDRVLIGRLLCAGHDARSFLCNSARTLPRVQEE